LRVSFVIGYATGRENRTVMVATHKTAIQPMNKLKLPRLKGPFTKVLRARVIRHRIGRAYAMYKPIVAIETIAWNATILHRDCKGIKYQYH